MKWGKLEFDEESYEVSWDGIVIKLTPKELFILKYFMENPRALVTPQDLIENVRDKNLQLLWPSAEFWPVDSTIRSHVNHLRKKIRKVSNDDPMSTETGIGYRLKRTY